MTDCDHYKLQFSGYLDGELSLAQRKELEDHLAICSYCSEVLHQLGLIQQNLKGMSQISTSPNFEQELHKQLLNSEQQSHILPQPLQNWKLPAMGSALVLATVGMFIVFNHSIETNNAAMNRQKSNFRSATSQLQRNNQINQIGASDRTSTLYNGGTLIHDSLQGDSSQLHPDGFQLIGNEK